jgi:hypothetical protein
MDSEVFGVLEAIRNGVSCRLFRFRRCFVDDPGWIEGRIGEDVVLIVDRTMAIHLRIGCINNVFDFRLGFVLKLGCTLKQVASMLVSAS